MAVQTLARLARRLAGVGAVALLTTGVLASTAHAATDTPPRSSLSVTVANDGLAEIRGWAFDPDDVNAKLHVTITLDGKWYGVTKADLFSGELAPYGLFYSGYGLGAGLADGTHTICIFVQNVGSAPSDGVLTQCHTVEVNNQAPRGVMERDGNGTGFRGWVIDESNLNQSLDIFLVYVDTVQQVQRANLPSPQLYPYGIPGNHGYYFKAPIDPREPNLPIPGEFCVFAVNIGKGYSATIGCVEVA